MQNIKAAIIQSKLFWEDIDANINMFDCKIDEIKEPVDFIVLPEMFSTGFSMNAEKLAVTMDDQSVKWIKKKAADKNTDIAGSFMIKQGNHYFNRFIWAKPDNSFFIYDKRHLFRMSGEDRIYSAGKENITIQLKGWKIRPFICYDLRFPVWTRNKDNAFDIAVFVANWPQKRMRHWNILLKARAVENLSYVIGVNRVGKDGDGFLYTGCSQIIDPKGNTLFYREKNECTGITELSFKNMKYYRRSFPAWKDADSWNFGHLS